MMTMSRHVTAVERLHLPFEILSDHDFAVTNALRLPTFEFEGVRLLKRYWYNSSHPDSNLAGIFGGR